MEARLKPGDLVRVQKSLEMTNLWNFAGAQSSATIPVSSVRMAGNDVGLVMAVRRERNVDDSFWYDALIMVNGRWGWQQDNDFRLAE